MTETEKSRGIKRLSGMQLLAAGFLIMILIGTGLLMLPVSSVEREWTSFHEALFTATSAGCVTGLTVVDTYGHWSVFGQLVLLLLIQTGGLGFVTIGTAILMVLGGKPGFIQKSWVKESLNATDYGGLIQLLKLVLKGTLLFESLGAVILAVRFYPVMGLGDAVYFGVFHSVSAFCNAGFDLMGKYGMSSFTYFRDDPVVMITICALILIGGIGFIAWKDIRTKGLRFKKYSLQTKMVLSMSAVLVAGGTLFFYFSETADCLSGVTGGERLLSAFFCAVTPRTAGFNVIDYGSMSEGGKLATVLLMFIGGGSGSTAGGVKMTTVFALLLHLRATLNRSIGVQVMGRRIPEETILKATALASMYVVLSAASCVLICALQGFSEGDVIFEVVSAICTVGITTGITRSLSLVSRLVIIALMYLGRLNSLSFALSFTDHKKITRISSPAEEISIG
ncbi:MAG: Trk family potassium uptake protein [Firmicutes bacterium]|nr:Trk family potassium uptake protein [Bacillota bacterium]